VCVCVFFYWVFEGSLVLVGGDPGVGKSTLLLQVEIFCKD
jgi:predicted ATP-dependent serine protease